MRERWLHLYISKNSFIILIYAAILTDIEKSMLEYELCKVKNDSCVFHRDQSSDQHIDGLNKSLFIEVMK